MEHEMWKSEGKKFSLYVFFDKTSIFISQYSHKIIR